MKKPTSRAIWVAKVNLRNTFDKNWNRHWSKADITRIRKESIQVLRAAKAHNLV